MTLQREFRAYEGDRFRIMCPDCGATWTTLRVPAECDCGTVVTFRVSSRRKPVADGEVADDNRS